MKKIVLGLLTIIALSGASQSVQASKFGWFAGGAATALVADKIVRSGNSSRGYYNGQKVYHSRHGDYVRDYIN